jgi:hypothetical protein
MTLRSGTLGAFKFWTQVAQAKFHNLDLVSLCSFNNNHVSTNLEVPMRYMYGVLI